MTSRATIRIAVLAGLCHAGFAEPARNPARSSAATPAASSNAASAAGLAVRAVKFWSLGNSTRIAIEVSADFQYRKDRLDNPNRMFVDIAGAQPRIEGQLERGQYVITVGDKFVKQIRVAIPRAGTTRVVLDLEPGVECVTSQLSDPDRLMIEVTTPGRTDTPIVTPSVVGIKRFEPPPITISHKSAPPPEINFIDDPAPQVAAKMSNANPLPTAKQRRLLASAAAAAPPPPPPPPADPEPEPVIKATVPATELSASLNPAPVFPDGAPLPAKRNANGDRTMARVFGLKIKRIVIDAGHGGKDEGTRGPKGLLEKDLVLDVAKRLGALLSDRLGVEVVYTRTDDTFIPLEQRTVIANDRQGDLFISLHANASTIRSVSGVEIYYLSFSNSKVDLDTAARENAGAESSVHELETLLQKAMLNDKLKESSEFASKVLQAMTGTPEPPVAVRTPANRRGGAASAAAAESAKNGVRSRGIRRAPFIVLIGAHMPSVLAEIGFISNPGDEAQMMKSAHRQKIAESLAKGIEEYAQSFSRFQVAARQSNHAAARPPAPAATAVSETRP